jgi:hypothetical protein
VLHRVKVPRDWLAAGEVIEVELPRNLSCAACGGGGCDTCGRSGAITLRRRDELAEVVEVTLPTRPGAETESLDTGITLRIPEQGGLPDPGSDLPRGMLLLTVVPAETADPRISLARSAPSPRPDPSSPLEVGVSSPGGSAGRSRLALLVAILVVLLAIAFLVWLKLSRQS